MRYLTILALTGILGVASLAPAQRSYRPTRYGADGTVELAHYWINSYLRRGGTPAEGIAVAQDVRARGSLEALATFLANEEYFAYSGGTRAGFINQLILDVGHHHPEPGELSQYQRRMAGLDRRTIAYQFLREYPRNWVPGLGG